MRNFGDGLRLLAGMLQLVFMVVFAAASLVLLVYTVMCAAGMRDWLVMPLQFGSAVYEAGVPVQIAMTLLALGLLVYLPANRRIMALETSHRDFSIHMADVSRAYAAVHQADRTGVFTLSHEFDAVKERIAYLRDHPDLGMLEPDVLEVAAQMSVISRELGEIYSNERVARARKFLKQRQEEVEAFQVQLDDAKGVANEILQWANRVEIEEDVARSELARLSGILDDILPELPAVQERPTGGIPDALLGDNVASFSDRQAAE